MNEADLSSCTTAELDEMFTSAMAEHDAILSQERVPVSTRERLADLQSLCFAILAERGTRVGWSPGRRRA